MFCRRAWQRVGPLAWRSLKLPCRSAPVRHMSSGLPGGSSNMTYFILCGGGLTAAVIYAYKSVNGDTERYEDGLANVDTSAKTAAPATEATPVEEAAPVVEDISEPVFTPAEPVLVAAAELVVESASEEAADVACEVHVVEAAAEPAATEEAAPPVAVEVAAAEEAPVAVAMETPAEAPAVESTGSVADLFTAVKVLSGSTVEIAAASVGEKSLVNAVQQIQEDGEALTSSEEVVKPEVLEATADLFTETAAAVNEEEEKSAEAGAADELSDDEEAIAEEEGAAPSSHEQFTASAQAAEEVVEVAVEDPGLNPPKEALLSIEASPEDASPAEQLTIAAEAPPADDTSGAETSVETAAEALAEGATEAATAHVTQLAAASTASESDVLSAAEPGSDAPGHEAKHCHSCHSAPSAVEEAVPPTEAGQELNNEGGVDTAHEVKEVASLVTKTSENMVVTSES